MSEREIDKVAKKLDDVGKALRETRRKEAAAELEQARIADDRDERIVVALEKLAAAVALIAKSMAGAR